MAITSEDLVGIITVATAVNATASLGTLIFSHYIKNLTVRNVEAIEEIHKATNSMKDELVAVTRSDARQKGVSEGKAIQKAIKVQGK